MSIFQNGALYLHIQNVAAGYADTDAFDSDDLPIGAAVLVKTDDKTVEEGACAASTTYEIVSKASDGIIRRSPTFATADIIAKTTQAYALSTEQVKFFGYDGSSVVGFGTPVVGSTYTLAFWLKHTANSLNNTPEVKTIHYVAADTTQAVMAKGFQDSFLRTFSTLREPNKVILCDRVALGSATLAALSTATAVKLTNGSKTVEAILPAIATAAFDPAASTTSVTIATVFNIPSYNGRTFTFAPETLGSGAGYHTILIGTTAYTVADDTDAASNGTAICAAINAGTQARATGTTTVTITYREGQYYLPPVVGYKNADADGAYDGYKAVTIATGDSIAVKYKIAATVSAATFTLDNPWQGPTGYVIDGTTEATNVGIFTLTSDTWGLKFTGVAQPFNAVTDEVNKVAFDIQSSDFGTLVEYESVKPTLGSGTYQQVSYLEKFAQWSDKGVGVSTYPPTTYAAEAVSGYGYNLYTVVVNKKPYTSVTTGVTPSNVFTMIVALKATSAYDTLASSDPWGTIFG